jgi:inhibitor of cysteine peptidase
MNGKLATAALLALCVTACGGERGLYWPVVPPDVPAPRVVDDGAAGSTVDIARTQWILVRLPADPASGYRWSYELGKDRVLYPSGDTPRFEPSPAGSPAGAAPGASVFTFRAEGVGTTGARFLYRRVGEPDSQPARIVAFDVVAR